MDVVGGDVGTQRRGLTSAVAFSFPEHATMSTTNTSTSEVHLEQRRVLEAVARHNESLEMQARRNGDVEAVERFSKSAMACRLRWPRPAHL
jgi:hypothetical protein